MKYIHNSSNQHSQFKMLDRTHLAIIEAVHRLGTLTEAANELCLTQSALSHAIKKLEQQLGTPVWQKQGRRLRLSEAGEHLLGLANRILPQFEHAEQWIAAINEGSRGTLRIGMECHPCYEWLLKVVAPYLKQYPDVDVDVCRSAEFGGIGALLGYDIDVLITPDPLNHKRLEYIEVYQYEHVLAVSKEHRLAGKAHIEPQMLARETLVTYPVELSRLDIFSRFLTPAGCTVKKHKIVETTEIMLQMVDARRAIAALPRWLVEQYQQEMHIMPLRLGKNGIHKTLCLGFRAGENKPLYQQQFIKMAETVT